METTQVGQGAVRGLSYFLITIFSFVVAVFPTNFIFYLIGVIFPRTFPMLIMASFGILAGVIYGFIFIISFIIIFILMKKTFAKYNHRVLIYIMLAVIFWRVLEIAVKL